MTLTDWIGFTGVTILLVAYFLNLRGLINKDGLGYLLLNILGAGIACLASLRLMYWPFIILEGCWTLVSIYELFNYFQKKQRHGY